MFSESLVPSPVCLLRKNKTRNDSISCPTTDHIIFHFAEKSSNKVETVCYGAQLIKVF